MRTTHYFSRRIVLVFLATLACNALFAATGEEMSAPDAFAASKAGKLVLLDIRTPAEWAQTGVPSGAARVDIQNPKGDAGFIEEVLKQTKGDKNAPVALICRSGNRSTQGQKLLEAQGFTHVLNVKEGVSGGSAGPGWLRRALPLQ